MSKAKSPTFLPDGVTFVSQTAASNRMVYAPLCGSDASGLKSSITPLLSGDIKVDKFHYVTKPASREDLRYPVRDFFIHIAGKGVCSIAQGGPDNVTVKVGQIWHETTRACKPAGLTLSAVNFIPSTNETVELMKVTVTNTSRRPVTFTPTAAVPIFGRSLANKHDHEHVTALLNRNSQLKEGVCVEPSMAFNEEGHKTISQAYFVFGADEKGALPAGTFPTADAFYGDGGNICAPWAVMANVKPVALSPTARQGKEAVGALRFKTQTLKPGQSKSYIIAIGLAASLKEARAVFGQFNDVKKCNAALEENIHFWRNKISTLQFQSGDPAFNAWMRWVTLQPILRRIFGCSFLPDHDYGKGGKGWRDLWQDLLSLILIEPQQVRDGLLNNCAGIRIDGSNATIIGTKPGEFIADRNAITRVWMDHGCWPFLTLLLYIHQTGDFDILFQMQNYFRDPQQSRSTGKDHTWTQDYGNKLRDKNGQIYEGTILEHLLVQNLVQFFNVGEHNMIRLESADWNDGLDMAFHRGESTAFTAFYGGNFMKLADLLEDAAQRKGIASISIARELSALLDTLGGRAVDYNNAHAKQAHLRDVYFVQVQPVVSGEKIDVPVADIVRDLRQKGRWIFEHIRKHEQVTVKDSGIFQWFNGYYDNTGTRVEGPGRMTLTGQVFPIMSGLANDDEIGRVVQSVERFLRDKKLGGYRLNTDFGLPHYLDLGRAFGFAYGTKENGAFFSHMNVMYAYALYARGFAREGHEVIHSIFKMAQDLDKSKIYPGIPEYFDSEGRGMYHYLTGSASWMVLTELTQVFGVRGHYGDLVLAPQLVKAQFDRKGAAAVKCPFAGHMIHVEYHNPHKLDVGCYTIKEITLDGAPLAFEHTSPGAVLIQRSHILKNTSLKVLLDAK